MINKKDSSDPIDNLEYEKVLEEEIINSNERKFLIDTEPDKKISTIIPTFIKLIFYPLFSCWCPLCMAQGYLITIF